MYLTVVPKKFKREKERDFNLVVNTIYNQGVDKLMTNYQEYSHNYLPTWTRHIEDTTAESPRHLDSMNQSLDLLSERCVAFMNSIGGDTSTQYEHFAIPKHSGGLRHISAPNAEIKELQSIIVDFFRWRTRSLEHQCAYAYVRGRCTKDALITHQHNDARWFLKLDLKDFFPSCTKPFIMKQLIQLYPLNFLDETKLGQVIDVCLLDGGLPQGAPTSPIITNLIMLPIDFHLNKRMYNFKKSRYTYTRYADDLLISNQYNFKYTDVVAMIKEVLHEQGATFQINDTKTRYGSASGRNWNLGLMFTNKGNITVGHKRKRRVKSMLSNFFRDNTGSDATWSKEDTQILLGEVAYIKQIEPDYPLVEAFESKWNIKLSALAKPILRSEEV
jgi:hypothetical protein